MNGRQIMAFRRLGIVVCILTVVTTLIWGQRPADVLPNSGVWVNPKDQSELVWVPAGPFVMGCNDMEFDERPTPSNWTATGLAGTR